MRRWFLSYHSPDQALAERLKAALERKDTDAHVFSRRRSLRAGGLWSRALAEEIAQADAFILLVGEKGVGDWQVLEYDEALDKRVKFPDFPVILMLLEGQTAPGLPFLRRLHWIITARPVIREGRGAAVGCGIWHWHEVGRSVALHVALSWPFRDGGERQRLLLRAGARNRRCAIGARRRRADRLPVLLGNSGVGKSSLAQAGVLAALKRQAWPEGADAAPGLAACLSGKPPLVLPHAQARDRAAQGAGRVVSRHLAV